MKKIDENQIKRLRWRCRRGMKELDVLLENYLANTLPDISEETLDLFTKLLNSSDPELYDWFTGKHRPKEDALYQLVKTIGSFSS